MIFIRVEASINENNLIDNINVIKQLSNKDLIAVVKSNAYGHGSREVVSILKKANVEYIVVATLEEAIELSDLMNNILLLETLNKDQLKVASYFNIILSLTSEEYIDRLIEFDFPFRCHLKIDTGMKRYGIDPSKVEMIINKIKKSSLKLEGIYTHFAANSKKEMEEEFELFKKSIKNIDTSSLMIHTQKSNAVFEIKDDISTHCRVGAAMYGIANMEHRAYLKPILNLYAYPTRIFKVKKGDSIGYNLSYLAPSDGYAITLDYGYSDGILTRDDIIFMVNQKIYHQNRDVLCMDSMIVFMEDKVDYNTKFEFVNDTLNLNYYRDLRKDKTYQTCIKLNKRIRKKVS